MRTPTPAEEDGLAALTMAFASVGHELWSGRTLHGAPTRTEELQALRDKGEANWSASDIDWVFFKSATTIGSANTVKFAFPRLVEALLREAELGMVSAAIIPSKLQYAGFEAWPSQQRNAALAALDLLVQKWSAEEYPAGDPLEMRAFISRHR